MAGFVDEITVKKLSDDLLEITWQGEKILVHAGVSDDNFWIETSELQHFLGNRGVVLDREARGELTDFLQGCYFLE